MQGIVLKGVGGFYTVLAENGSQYTCRARGRFRINDISPVPGDRVEFDQDGDTGYMKAILPRKNLLKRPMVANLDKLIIVISASAPKPDLLMVDKLLIYCELKKIVPILVQNKYDELNKGEDFLSQYMNTGYTLCHTSALDNTGLDGLMRYIQGSTVCFAGQSAVGKSSLLNALMPGIDLEVGGLSKKTDRGKHTTRHAQLIPISHDTAVMDTPGFSLLEIEEIDEQALSLYYPEMRDFAANCRFSGCLHLTEPDCAVKEALARNEVSEERYSRYKTIISELIERRKHKYD